MGLTAGNHPSFSKLTGTEQGIAAQLAETSGSEVLPFPPGLGRGSLVVAAESVIWPRSKILIVAEASEHQDWHQRWEEFGSGVNAFYYGVPAAPWGGPGRDDPPGGVCVVKPAALTGKEGTDIIARGWDLALFACPKASHKARTSELRSWVLARPDDPDLDSLSEFGQYLQSLDLSKVYDHVPTVVRPGSLLRPSSLAEAGRLVAA